MRYIQKEKDFSNKVQPSFPDNIPGIRFKKNQPITLLALQKGISVRVPRDGWIPGKTLDI